MRLAALEAMAVRDWRDANGAIEDGHGMPCPYEAVLASGIVS